jgi:mannose-6-phosphate isomerase-like protein (cupin superfamily)
MKFVLEGLRGNRVLCESSRRRRKFTGTNVRRRTLNEMNAIKGYFLITPDDLHWRPSNLMKIPNADYLERTGSENLGARLWRLPPKSANTLHKHVRAEEFYFVLKGTGRMRVGNETLTVPEHGGVLVGPDQLRQVFNDTDAEALWLIIGGPEELEFLAGSKSKMDLSLIYPTDPTQLPKELAGVNWPPTGSASGQ